METSRTNDANRSVVDVELFVLLKRLAERVQTMLDQLFQSTLKRVSKSWRQVIKETNNQ